jgi:hypothetical protein
MHSKIDDKMNSTAMLIFLSLMLVAVAVVFALPNPVQAKISYCADGAGIFQCFIKENDCASFAKAHPATTCIRSLT